MSVASVRSSILARELGFDRPSSKHGTDVPTDDCDETMRGDNQPDQSLRRLRDPHLVPCLLLLLPMPLPPPLLTTSE